MRLILLFSVVAFIVNVVSTVFLTRQKDKISIVTYSFMPIISNVIFYFSFIVFITILKDTLVVDKIIAAFVFIILTIIFIIVNGFVLIAHGNKNNKKFESIYGLILIITFPFVFVIATCIEPILVAVLIGKSLYNKNKIKILEEEYFDVGIPYLEYEEEDKLKI